MFTLNRLFILLITTASLAACSGGSDRKQENACVASGEELFECIEHDDFMNYQGQQTALSKRIARCTIIEFISEICSLSDLNFIANDNNINTGNDIPSKQAILNKLIVSDIWMADNFSSLLDNMPDDLYRLFASTTAIVIHRQIRPAFFLSETGAIYLDPDYLWITTAQRDSIPDTQDFRAGFSSGLSYITFYRYSKNGSYAFSQGDGSRNSLNTLYALSALLFHELAHARDFFPLDVINMASNNERPYDITLSIGYTSENLHNSYPLTDETMADIARVKFRGETASNYIRSLSASDVGSLFDQDGANDEYNYSSNAEDVAMLFEEIMMKQHYDIDRELAFVTALKSSPQYCEDYRWDYTVINRFSDNNVLNRVALVVDDLLPVNSSSSIINSPPNDGIFTWCQGSLSSYYSDSVNNSRGLKEPIPKMDYWH
jgi:hypothetical protein